VVTCTVGAKPSSSYEDSRLVVTNYNLSKYHRSWSLDMSDVERLTPIPAHGSAAREVEVPLQHLRLEDTEIVSSDAAPYLSDGSDWGFMAGIKGHRTVKRRGSRKGHRRDARSECSSLSSGHASPFLYGPNRPLFRDQKPPSRRASEDFSYLAISPKPRNRSVSNDTLHRDYILGPQSRQETWPRPSKRT
jgi:hypothetical protein